MRKGNRLSGRWGFPPRSVAERPHMDKALSPSLKDAASTVRVARKRGQRMAGVPLGRVWSAAEPGRRRVRSRQRGQGRHALVVLKLLAPGLGQALRLASEQHLARQL